MPNDTIRNYLLNQKLFLILLSTFILSCQDNGEQPKPDITLLTLKTLSHNDFQNHERWVILSDAQGAILSFKQIKENSTEIFTTTQPFDNFINITFLDVSLDPGITFYTLKTYTEIKAGDTWYFPTLSSPMIVPSIGELKVNINNINRIYNYNALDLITASDSRGGKLISYNSSSSSLWSTTLSMLVKKDPQPILIGINDGINEPAFKWVNEVMPDTSFTFDFQNDFQPMDEMLEFSFPQASNIVMDIKAFESYEMFLQPIESPRTDGYTMSGFYRFNGGVQSFKVGYLKDFNYYSTFLNLTYPDKSVSYFKVGEPPSVFTEALFDSDFEVLSSQFADFAFTASGDFEYVYTFWRSNVSIDKARIRWNVYYPIDKQENKILTAFPDDIHDKYPFLSLDKIEYSNAYFVDNINNEPYEFFIESLFHIQEQLVEVERYTLSK